jgi:tocopherol O-methyltransferase
MIVPREPQTGEDVAGHYDELDHVYREVWGEHVHHGLWRTGRESCRSVPAIA